MLKAGLRSGSCAFAQEGVLNAFKAPVNGLKNPWRFDSPTDQILKNESHIYLKFENQ